MPFNFLKSLVEKRGKDTQTIVNSSGKPNPISVPRIGYPRPLRPMRIPQPPRQVQQPQWKPRRQSQLPTPLPNRPQQATYTIGEFQCLSNYHGGHELKRRNAQRRNQGNRDRTDNSDKKPLVHDNMCREAPGKINCEGTNIGGEPRPGCLRVRRLDAKNSQQMPKERRVRFRELGDRYDYDGSMASVVARKTAV